VFLPLHFPLNSLAAKSRQTALTALFHYGFMKFDYLILFFTSSVAMRIHNSKPEEL